MKLNLTLRLCLAMSASPLAIHAQTPKATATASAALAGKGLAQHPFLYCGEWQDKGKSEQKMVIVRNGKVDWTYSIPGQEEYGDCTRLSNGNIVFSRRLRATSFSG